MTRILFISCITIAFLGICFAVWGFSSIIHGFNIGQNPLQGTLEALRGDGRDSMSYNYVAFGLLRIGVGAVMFLAGKAGADSIIGKVNKT